MSDYKYEISGDVNMGENLFTNPFKRDLVNCTSNCETKAEKLEAVYSKIVEWQEKNEIVSGHIVERNNDNVAVIDLGHGKIEWYF